MKNNAISREAQLTEAQFGIMSSTGKISGEVKHILTSKDKQEVIEQIESINSNLKDLVADIKKMCNALNLDFNNLVGEINE